METAPRVGLSVTDDLVEGLLRMMGTQHAVTGPVNLGNPGEFTIAELADLVIELTGTSSPVERLPLPADDPVRRQPDITLAKTVLGWQPTIQLREGLLRTIDYFRSSDSTFMAPAIATAQLNS
jgi:UDP-glucuronate decarboxylase